MLKKIASLVVASVMTLSSFSVSSVLADSEAGNDTETNAKVVAFPGAEGGGMYATGVRGAIENNDKMEVYHVTNLNDSGSGSFRDAVSKSNRIIVFDVSGYVDLDTTVTINKENITILGQTAPGDGVCFRSNNIKVSGKNIILRYVRFRVGDKLKNGDWTRTQDGLEVTDNTQNVIIDHCSVSWGTDENLSCYAVKDITIQNSIIAESLNQSIHDKGEHSYAAIWGGVNLSVHHNIIANHKSRNPKIGTSETVAMTSGYKDSDTVVDIRNNIFYNWGDKAGYGAENDAGVNIINNWYKPGPATPDEKRARIFEYSVGNKYQKNWSGRVYANGNHIDVDENDSEVAKEDAARVNANNYQADTGVYPDPKYTDMTYTNLDKPIDTYINDYPITTTSAEEAYNYVLNNAGARLPKMDAVDERIIDNVKNRTAPTGSKGSVGLVDSPIDGLTCLTDEQKANYDDRGYPVISEVNRTTDDTTFDADSDGIADAWEDKMGLDKTNPNDSLNIGPNGYTWLEIYAETIGKDDATLGLAIDGDSNVCSKTDDMTINLTYPQDTSFVDLKVFANDELVKEEKNDDNSDVSVGSITVGNLPLGENYITVIGTKADGSTIYSNTKVVYVKGDSYSGDDFTNNSQGNAVVTKTDDGKYYMYSDGTDSAILAKDISGGFSFVVNLGDITNLSDGVETGVAFHTDSATYKIYKTVKDGEVVWICEDSSGKNVVSVSDTYKANILKVSGDEAGAVELYLGDSLASLKQVTNITVADVTKLDFYVTAGENKKAISVANDIRYVSSDEITHPKLSIQNISDNQKLGFNTDIDVKVTPDSKAPINEIAVFFKDELIKTVKFDEGITQETAETIPVRFSKVDSGTLRVVCFDKNLGQSEDTKTVAISADTTPWETTLIGEQEGDIPVYVQATQDFTYKLNAPVGNISGTSDKYGYFYQQFNENERFYFRARNQASKNFGVMLKDNLDADGVGYYFGTEPNESMARGYMYVLKARTSKGGNYETIKSFENMTDDKYYFIIEKDGTKFKIYKTNVNSNEGGSVYKEKTLLCEVETGIGDTYYMGYAATDGVPDIGWLGLEQFDKSNEKTFKWNMDNGANWYWAVGYKEPVSDLWGWSQENIDGNETGKMVIENNDDYPERTISHDFDIEKGIIESGFDVFIVGEKPDIKFNLKTALGKAYTIEFNRGDVIFGGETLSDVSVNNSTWYKVKVTTDVESDVATITLMDVDGKTIVEKNVNATSVDNALAIYLGQATKTYIKQAFQITTVKGAQGTYYLDNMYVGLVARSSLADSIERAEKLSKSGYRIKTWNVLEVAFAEAKKVYDNENSDVEEILSANNALVEAMDGLEEIYGTTVGETITWSFADTSKFGSYIAAGSIPAGTTTIDDRFSFNFTSSTVIEGNNKTFDDGFKGGCRVKAGTQPMEVKVDGKADIVVYACSASGKENRNLVITDGTNTQKYLLSNTYIASKFSYTGDTPATIKIYGESGLNYYGVKYTPYISTDYRTGVTGYDKATGKVSVFNGGEGATKGVAVVIVTDDNGKVLETQSKEFEINVGLEETQEIDVTPITASGNIKVLLWDSLENMKPICNGYVVK